MEIQVLNVEERAGFPMLMPGDSGCMIYNELKQWVGLGIAVDSSDDSAFMSSAKLIVEDIQKRTGGITTLTYVF